VAQNIFTLKISAIWAAHLGIREFLGSNLGCRLTCRVTKLHGGAVYYQHNNEIFSYLKKVYLLSCIDQIAPRSIEVDWSLQKCGS
jgi:hypothetical protein